MTTFFTPDYLPLKKHCDTHQKTTSAIQNVVYNKLVKFSCVATFAIVTNVLSCDQVIARLSLIDKTDEESGVEEFSVRNSVAPR